MDYAGRVMKRLTLLVLALAAAVLLFAADPWKTKKAGEAWDADDLTKLMAKSPWAKETVVSMGGGGMGGPGGGGPPAMKALVRWESAQPMYDASKRERAKESLSHYIVSVTGLRIGGMMGGRGPAGKGGERKGGDEESSPEQRRQTMLDRMKENTMLERKGKDPIHPELVQPVQTSSGTILVFLFPRSGQPIALEDKEVTFHQKMGPMEVKAKFALKDMVYGDKLEL